jgi:predicted MFS family arabinose efflux permease
VVGRLHLQHRHLDAESGAGLARAPALQLAILLGLDAFLGELPIVLFSLVGGVVADRRDRRQLLLVSQVVQMSSALLLAVLGDLALTGFGAASCFALNGASFLAVVVALLSLRVAFIPSRTGESVIDSMKQDLKFVRRHPVMPSLVGLAFATTMLGVPLIVFLPVFAKNVFGRGASTYTLLLAIYGAGAIAGALTVAALGNIQTKGRAALMFLAGLGLAMCAFATSRLLAPSCVFLFVAGACLVGVLSLVGSLVQEIADDAMRGRVMSVYGVAFRGGMPVGSLVTGSLAPHLTAPVALAVNGALLFALGVHLSIVQRRVATL